MVPQTTTQSTPATTQTTQQPTPVATQTTRQPVAQPGAAAAAGIPEKKSVFKKWWFWLIIILVLVAIGVGIWLL